MKLEKLLVVSLVLVMLFNTIPVLADAAFGSFGVGAEPGDQDPRICVKHRDIDIGLNANPPGVNPLDWRTSLYAFTGEVIKFTIVVRDPNGALDIGFPKIQVGEDPYLVFPNWLELKTKGDASATWTTSNSYVDDYSILLEANGPGGAGNEGTIYIPLDMTLSELQTLSWWTYVQEGYIPHVDIRLDLNGDGVYTSGVDDALVIEYDKSTTPSDQPIGSMSYQLNTWVQTFDDKMTGIDDSTIAWLSSGAPGPVGGAGFISGTLSEWKAGTVSGGSHIDGSTRILALEIEVDDWIVISRAFIDDITINGQLYQVEPEILGGFQPEVLCNPTTLPTDGCDGFGTGTLDPLYHKAYHCQLTVEPGDPVLGTDMYDEKDVKITAYNSAFEPTDGTHVETWFFNPALSMSVSTSDSQAIHFEAMPYGADDVNERTVHSLNRLQVKNTAEGGVNMWMYLAGTDLFDPSGASKCPTSNVLSISNMAYRAWSGTQWQSWEGWVEMSKYDQNDNCVVLATGAGHCYGGKPVPFPNVGDAIPDWQEHMLTNQGKLEVEFKLSYPLPCVGTFSQGSLMVFGKAV